MILKIFVLFLLKRSECSIVVDSYDQKGIYLSDYCPQMEYCPEGAHVMCMYYHPDRVMGPRCSNPQNITITPALANQLLDITNAVRSKIATGKETGSNGSNLPRGYGIFRLKWDNELATFAQVLANQCVLRHDLCRATKRFPNPGQAAGLVRFSYPDWNPISRMSSNPPPGLDDSKMAFSVTQTLKSWYMKKAFVTPEMIEHYPVYTSTQNFGGKLYLETIHGPATHMGCGMSAYTEFAFYDTLYSMNYNSIQVICNFSARPKPGEMTYATIPEPGSSTCGCPAGTQEDSDCLCNEVEYKPEKPRLTDMGIQTEPDTCQQSDNCEPTLVLLPIFTVEDAPPQKLVDRAQSIREPLSKYVLQRLANRSDILQKSLTMNIEDIFGNNMQQLPGRQHPAMPASLKTVLGQQDHVELRSPQQKRVPQSPRSPPHHAIAKKSSIFTKADKFNLPSNKKRFSRYQQTKSIVKPRKDFRNMERVVDDYFKHRDNKNHQVVANKQQNVKANTFGPLIEQKTETDAKKSAEKGIEFDHILKPKYNTSFEDVDTNYEDDDKKLMNLLNTLEKEVKNVELDGSKKEIFDAKIRKIYGSVIGNSDLLLPSKPKSIIKLKSKSKTHVENNEPELFEHDLKASKSHSKHDSKHHFYDDLRNSLESNHLSEGNRHNYEHDVEKKIDHGKKHDHFEHYNGNFDEKPNTKAYNKYVDELENESFNDHEMSDVDQKLFADIEQKYNDRLAAYELNKLHPKFNENEDHKFIDKIENKYNNNFEGEYNEIAMHHYPRSRQQHNIAKNENMRKTIHANEENKHRVFENYRNGQPRNTHYNSNRNHFRNGEDDMKFGKEEADRNFHWNSDFEQEDPLSAERRKYYHEKIEALRSQLHERSLRLKHHERAGERITPRMRPNRENMDRTITKTHRDSIYVPDRARFLHGF